MNVLDIVIKEIRDEIERLKDDLAVGSPEDYAAYKYVTGIINGLWRAESYVVELNKKLEEFDE